LSLDTHLPALILASSMIRHTSIYPLLAAPSFGIVELIEASGICVENINLSLLF